MRDSRISLPPLVDGPVRGALRLSLGAPRWAEAAPAHLRQHAGDVAARVEWWGDASGGDLLPLPPDAAAAATSCLAFHLRTGPKYLTRYLRDMGALTITIEAAPSSSGRSAAAAGAAEDAERQPLAAATVGLLALDVQAPISGTYPLVLVTDAEGTAAGSDGGAPGSGAASADAAIVGSLEVRLELDYSSSSGATAVVSSFELNEHLAGSTAVESEGEDDAGSDRDGGSSDSGGSGDGFAAAAAPPTGLCEQLLAALQDRELVAAVVQQLASEAAADGQPALEGLQLQPFDVTDRLLPLLLPSASQPQLDNVAAMLQPFAGCSNSSWEGSKEHPPTTLSLAQLAAAAAEAATVERALASQPAAEALQGLRQAAAALASRSLDLAAAFGAADGQQLPLGHLGVLLQRLYPGATAQEARLLLAVVAADGGAAGAVTLPTLKAALARVQEAQQFPTAEDLARQQAAAEARRAKEAAAAAVAAIEQQRAAAAAAKAPPSQRKQAVVSKLKSSLQERRRSSTSGSSMQTEAQAAAVPAELQLCAVQQQMPQLPAVVLGIPVLPPPPPAAVLLTGQPAQPAAAQCAATAALAPQSASTDEAVGVAAALSSQLVEPSTLPEVPHTQTEQLPQSLLQDHGKPPQQQDALLQLIEQAEALKAAMQQGGSSTSNAAPSTASTRWQLWEAAAAAAPRLPNLLLPLSGRGGGISTGASEAAADSGGLSAATAALLAAARALRLEGEQLPLPGAPPATASGCSAAPPSAAAVPTSLAVPAAAGSAALLGHAATAAGDSDAESDAEDALLDQLFFQRTQRPAGLAGAADPAHAADSTGVQPATKQQEQAAQLVLRMQLGPPRLAGDSGRSSSSGGSASVRCVIKPLQAGGAPQQLNVPLESAAAAAPVTAELPVLVGVSGSDGRPPLLPPYLFLEFWRHSGDLLGVARVPLLLPPAACSPQQGFLAAVVAEGRQPIGDILEGRDAGTIHVAAVLQERGAAPQVAAVRHCFSVAIRSAHRLPSAAAYAGAGLRAPDARLLRYSFPGEPDALQTGEVPCCSSPSFDATATHEMTLPAGHSILPLLQDGLLRFELFDCWADQQQRQQHGWALLQLRELASLAAEAERGSSGSAAREASRSLLLPLCTEYESAEPFVPATLSVEIIRACGLGAAVREAAAASGGGAGTSLGRAAVVGPHAFVRLALFPEADAALQAEAPPLQTAFVPQSFCPAWRSVHTYPLQLTGSMVQALASQSMRVEVWHRCPRAAAGGSGREAREVLLGAGAVPLVDVLRKPQGLRCWVALMPGNSSGGSSRGGVVGAVQVAACLTSLGSVTGGAAEQEPLLLRCSEAAALVPAPLRPRLLVPPGAGFSSHSAVLAVHLDTLVPPSSSSLSSGRPKADRFFCRYHLPGTDGGSSTATASRVLSSVGSSALAAALRKGEGRSSTAGSAAAEQQQRWAAKLNHCGFFEVTADASLAAALLQGPLLVHVYKQPAGAATESGRSAVLVGTAEVDLASLLWADSGSDGGSGAEGAAQGQLRLVSGTCPLLEGASAAQGGASLAVRVELQLQPGAGAAQQAAAAAAAGAHTTALEHPQPTKEHQQPECLPEAGCDAPSLLKAESPQKQEQHQQPLEQQYAQPSDCPLSSDEDDDEAHEQLLQRCQRLTAALRNVCSPELAAAATAGACSGEAVGERSCGVADEQPTAGGGDSQQPAGQAAENVHAGSVAVPEQQQQQQQQQNAAAGQTGSSSPSPAVVQQDQPPGTDDPEEAGKLVLQIDSALHLPIEAPGSSSGSSSGVCSEGFSAFVVATWGQHQQRTEAVPVHVVAAAELGGTVVWHAELELPASASAWAAQPHQSSSSGTSSSGTSLVLDVWATSSASGSSSGGGSAQPPGTADSLLGCCVVDLRALPALQQVAGYWHIVDSQQRQQGQLKASVRANGALRDALQQQQRSRLAHCCDAAAASPAAPAAAAAAEGPVQREQQQREQLQQPAAAVGALDEDQPQQPEPSGGDLAQQVQAQLQELELLSQRLAGQPPAAAAGEEAEAAGGTLQQPAQQAGHSPAPVVQQKPTAASPAAGPGGDDPDVAAMLAAAGPMQADAELVKPFDTLPASDEEWDGSALPLDPRQERLFAWSGSDSDDGMGLVGIAVDGAISGEVTEEEQEEERPRAPARLLAEDWMFAISKTAAGPEEEEGQLAAAHAAGQQQQQQQQQPGGQPAEPRAAVSLLAQQRSELQQRSQEVRSPAAAATIDEVLAQLRGGSRGAAGRSGH
ncbi:hypothetical protein C2E21_0846 [Chlorella sorokiniana]|uniref:C2 domain-containing protein n=1 Tax=Chlorella sorokiniana TaxID=3076 RepID=A0A2P6U286_CHLSO|nr:hypothetical protein C2E21_0846 [Chlorella sorokiniana]|eukprot:PRW60425.1 hypothetical protein C2E21_0846 [Chlorella sorokiniana]